MRFELGFEVSAGKAVGWKLLVIVSALLPVTVFFPFAVYASIQRYDAWKQAELQRLPPEVIRYIDFDRMDTETSLLLTAVGPVLVCCWILLVAKHRMMKSRHKKNQVDVT